MTPAQKTAQEIAGEAYQVIGVVASAAGLFDHPDIQRALDYFSGDLSGEILPFDVAGTKQDHGSSAKGPIPTEQTEGPVVADLVRLVILATDDGDHHPPISQWAAERAVETVLANLDPLDVLIDAAILRGEA